MQFDPRPQQRPLLHEDDGRVADRSNLRLAVTGGTGRDGQEQGWGSAGQDDDETGKED